MPKKDSAITNVNTEIEITHSKKRRSFDSFANETDSQSIADEARDTCENQRMRKIAERMLKRKKHTLKGIFLLRPDGSITKINRIPPSIASGHQCHPKDLCFYQSNAGRPDCRRY